MRILGNFEDNHELTIHTSVEVKNNIIKEYKLFLEIKKAIKNCEDRTTIVSSIILNQNWLVRSPNIPLVPKLKGCIKVVPTSGSVRSGIHDITGTKDYNETLEIAMSIFSDKQNFCLITKYIKTIENIPYIDNWSTLTQSQKVEINKKVKQTILLTENPTEDGCIGCYTDAHFKQFFTNPKIINHKFKVGIKYGTGNETTKENFGIVVYVVSYETINEDVIIMWHDTKGVIHFDKNIIPTNKNVQVGKKSRFNIDNIRYYPQNQQELV